MNMFFDAFDTIARRHGCTKIKSCASRYVMVAGLPLPRPDHAEAAAECALEMLVAGHAIIDRFEESRAKEASLLKASKGGGHAMPLAPKPRSEAAASSASNSNNAEPLSPRMRALKAESGSSFKVNKSFREAKEKKEAKQATSRKREIFGGVRVGLHSGPLVAGIMGRGPSRHHRKTLFLSRLGLHGAHS